MGSNRKLLTFEKEVQIVRKLISLVDNTFSQITLIMTWIILKQPRSM